MGQLFYYKDGFTIITVVVFEVTGNVPKEASVFPLASVVIVFSLIRPVILSRIILPVDLLFMVVVVSLPIISALVTVIEFSAKSTRMVESLMSETI